MNVSLQLFWYLVNFFDSLVEWTSLKCFHSLSLKEKWEHRFSLGAKKGAAWLQFKSVRSSAVCTYSCTCGWGAAVLMGCAKWGWKDCPCLINLPNSILLPQTFFFGKERFQHRVRDYSLLWNIDSEYVDLRHLEIISLRKHMWCENNTSGNGESRTSPFASLPLCLSGL